jgi:hypothetical protein
MRFAAVLVVSVACSAVLASSPGQPLDCSDWVFLEPGLSCRIVVADCSQVDIGAGCANLSGRPSDGDGTTLIIETRSLTTAGCPGTGAPGATIQIARVADGVRSVIASISSRCGSFGTTDDVQYPNDTYAGFDLAHGRLYLGLLRRCEAGAMGVCSYQLTNQLVAIDGFTTTFEVLQTYSPQLGFRVPYMPEGMPGADSFDTYWGPLTKPIDFTQAHPLQCDYPATAPHVGDYLTAADTVPTPASGQGVYYVTAATYQGTTRYGRKSTAGQLRGRDPALLPACGQQLSRSD